MEGMQSPDLSNGAPDQNTSKRASWDDTVGFKEHFVTLLHENAHMYQGYKKGWSKETWKQVTDIMRARFQDTSFSTVQLKQLEQDLKKNYKNIKDILGQPGFTWDDGTCTLQASDHQWSSLSARDSKAKKWRTKIFRCYSWLDALYGGHYVQEPQAMSNNALFQHNSSQFTSNSTPAGSIGEMNPSRILAQVNQMDCFREDPEVEGELDSPNFATSQNQPNLSFQHFGLADQNAATGVPDFSIGLCLAQYERLGSNQDDLVYVGDIFKDEQNCETFLALREDCKICWLQTHIMNRKIARFKKSP